MISKFYYFIFFCSIVFFVGCESSKKPSTTYFGGKIINPKSNFIVLYKAAEVVDTILLDKNHRFIKKLEKIEEGFYYFSHGGENQYIYLENNDSLMIRLNTWDFDESLVFAGKGAERNNILIDCFLEDESDNNFFRKIVGLEPQAFKQKTDSLLSVKKEAYNNYVLNHPLETDGFKEMLNVALTYPLYSRIERYPVIHVRHSNDSIFHKIEDFFSHRSEIDINNKNLMYYPPYTRYVRNYLYNETYALGHPLDVMEYSSDFTVDLLNIINSKVDSKTSKDAFLKQTVIWHFYRKSSCDVNKKPFETFFELSSNKRDINLLENLLADTKKLHQTKPLPNFHIFDMLGSEREITQIIKRKKSFIFFWNPEYVSKDYIAPRINYLMTNYPKVHFITVKIDGSKDDTIPGLDIKNQYYINTSNEVNQYLTSKMPRSIIVNRNGMIENGYASLSSRKLAHQLKAFSKN
jgi:hypothetical protein